MVPRNEAGARQWWAPNPSGLVANHRTRRLCDDLDDRAIWIGVFDRTGTLAGVTRLIDRSVFGRLELERYVELPGTLVSGRVVVEPNRLAIRPHARAAYIFLALHLSAHRVARLIGAERSVFAAGPRLAAAVERDHGWRDTGIRFRYHPSDPSPVVVMGLDS